MSLLHEPADPAVPRSPLDRAFRPQSVAILGASDDPTRISGRALHYLLRAGFSGGIFPVNNKRDTVQGINAYRSLADVPGTPDVALIALPSRLLAAALRECVAKGVAAAVIYAAGFAETGESGAGLQDELVEIARAGGLRLFGPNCLGLMNSASGFVGTFSSAFDAGTPKGGGVAIASQSGAYGGHLAYLCRERGLDVGYWVSTGNESDVDVATCIDWLARQDEVTVIMAYLEGATDGDRLRAALATARAHRKPVVITKVGKSAAGAVAAASHTASLAGADGVYDAVFAEFGAYRARTTQELVDIAYACDRGVFPRGRRLGIVTVSGGFGVELCDAAERYGLDVAGLPEAARARLRELNPMGSDDNPCDTTANWLNDPSLITKTFQIMYGGGDYDSVIGSFTILPDSPTFGAGIRDAIRAGTEGYLDRPTALCMQARPDVVRAYEEAGFLVFGDSDRAAHALAALARIAESFAASPHEALDPGTPTEANLSGLSEADAQEVLAEVGVPFLPSRLVHDRESADAAAREFAVALAAKIVSPDLAHKTDVGGVELDVTDAAAAFDSITTRVAAARPDARIDGVLLTPMAPSGVELIVGTSTDAVFGPVTMVGLGGVAAELHRDVVLRVGAVTVEAAREMVLGLRSAALLTGHRGAPAADLDALARLISTVSRFAVANRDRVASVELNPVLACPDRTLALDALIITHSQKGTTWISD
ncbi:acetate--CoA ligase family protein [Nocardia jiangxiensis]|uniref:acetate--CoA ligase family protein n=1 Tax=Nocardia jiangxiensis TaxID=282685 RepID=UPI0005926B16|nr:acetate--CoA ligase family protein [Nocardia jiangxiensis]